MTVVKLKQLEELKRQIDALDNVVGMFGERHANATITAYITTCTVIDGFRHGEASVAISGELRDQICKLLQAERDRKRKEFEEA